ncbi:MAG: DUF2325 domain-containing protein [Eubacteriaceae bacterium]|jgi:hypothetical protein
MSIVILGGNERMERRYKDLCEQHKCQVKVFAQPIGNLKRKIGSPDLMIFFTNTMSHKMVMSAMHELKGKDTVIARSQTSSVSALKNILNTHAPLAEPSA